MARHVTMQISNEAISLVNRFYLDRDEQHLIDSYFFSLLINVNLAINCAIRGREKLKSRMTSPTRSESCAIEAIVESVAELHLSELLTEQTGVRRAELTVACGSFRHTGGEQVHVA